jgi:enamine deaminase RidA (YjgF/YER057c/UK114 family)
MPRQTLDPDTLFPSRQYGFAQIVTAPAAGSLVFISGQVAWDAEQQIVGPGDLGLQARQALENVATAVAAAGGSLADVVSLRIYIVADRMGESSAIREALHAFFPGEHAPTATWIGVPALADEAFLVEIEPIAVIAGPA